MQKTFQSYVTFWRPSKTLKKTQQSLILGRYPYMVILKWILSVTEVSH